METMKQTKATTSKSPLPVGKMPTAQADEAVPVMARNKAPATPDPGAQTGSLPETGWLANTYVPIQEPGAQYDKNEGLMHGTLFPGLNLPFQNRVNTRDVANTPLGEIMALDFAVHELGMYLDLHKDDKEALELFENYAKMSEAAKKRYSETHGPLEMTANTNGSYKWSETPWPWERTASAATVK